MVIKEALRILDPVVEPWARPVSLAPRVKTLDGKTVGLYTNAKTNATEILEMVSAMLREQFQIKAFVRAKFPISGRVSEDHRMADVAVLAIGD